MTNNEFVSTITNILKTNNRDDRISKRFILKLAQDSAQFLISQKLLDRTITLETNLYTTINCFDFEKVEGRDCSNIEFRYCKTLMRSKNKLPKLVFSRLGASIKDIVALDGDYKFVYLDKGQYQRNKNRQYSIKDEVYVYLDTDMRLYIPDKEIYTVDITLLTTDNSKVDECSSCSDKKNKCKSKWDDPFICPDKLIETVKDMVIQRLGMTRQIREDSNPDNKVGN
jgi:hypothetical protein